MSTERKMENVTESLKGKAKEAVGKATADRPKEAEGKGQQAKADVKQAMEKMKDAAKH